MPVVAESAKLLNRVLLMDEAVATHQATEKLLNALAKSDAPGMDGLRCRLRRVKQRAWTRYLRRWADACEHGHAGHWFEPWIAKKEAT